MNLISITTYILITFTLDMIFSYKYLNAYRKRFPKHDWTQSEANPIIRASVKSFGLGQGIVIAAFTILCLIVLILSYTGERVEYFLGGVYSMALAFHYINFAALKRLEVKA